MKIKKRQHRQHGRRTRIWAHYILCDCSGSLCRSHWGRWLRSFALCCRKTLMDCIYSRCAWRRCWNSTYRAIFRKFVRRMENQLNLYGCLIYFIHCVENRMDTRLIEKTVLSGSLLYALYITVSCPCKTMYSCHYWPLVISAGIPIVYCVAINSPPTTE